MFLNDECSEGSWWCSSCACALCAICDGSIHVQKAFKSHERQDLRDYVDYIENFYVGEKKLNPESLLENYIVHVSSIDNKMTKTSALSNLLSKIDNHDCPSFISMVGPTGAGKSLIIRLLAKAMLEKQRASIPLPIPGKPTLTICNN